METVMQIFAIFGIIISLVALILFISWAVSFYTSVAFKTFKHSLNKYVEVKNEDIEKKSIARRERLEKAREQKNQHKKEMQEVKLQSKQDLFEIKKRELIAKENAKVSKAKNDANMKTGLDFNDIGGNLTEEFFEKKKEEMIKNSTEKEVAFADTQIKENNTSNKTNTKQNNELDKENKIEKKLNKDIKNQDNNNETTEKEDVIKNDIHINATTEENKENQNENILNNDASINKVSEKIKQNENKE